jgi:choline dehydrogenase-like flavoprotein
VRRICFSGARATAVEIERDNTVEVIESDEIFVSAGAIGSPHLLLLSGIGPAADLAAMGIAAVVDLPGVGRNLHDHSSIGLRWTTPTVHRLPAHPVHTHQLKLAYTSSPEHGRNDIRMRCQSFYLAPDSNGVNRIVTGALGIRTTLQNAYSVGELRLASSDPDVDPILDYRHLDAAADRSRLRDAVRLALELTSRATARRNGGRARFAHR